MFAEVAEKVISYSKEKRRSCLQNPYPCRTCQGIIVFFRERLPEVSWQFVATFGAIIAMSSMIGGLPQFALLLLGHYGYSRVLP